MTHLQSEKAGWKEFTKKRECTIHNRTNDDKMVSAFSGNTWQVY